MTETTLKGRTSSAPGKAILCMLLGSAFLISNDAVLKWMTGNYHVGQLLFCRGIFIGLPLAILIWRAGGLKSLRIINSKDHILRAILVIVGTFLFISSLKYLPIADAVAITFAGPLFVTALAPRLLGERVGWRRWMAVFAGFIGIIVIMRPGGGLIQWAALLPLAASLTGAFRDILTRHMSAKETTVSLLFYTSLAVTLAGLATTPFVWTPVPLADWGWFALSGLLVGGAHFLMIETFRFGEAALVAPFRYSGVIWAALIGYFVWGDIPDSGTIMGISIVVISGIYILHRQRVRKGT
jgi:drug/metabolite transporter (DMT)-like permease